MTRPRFGYLSLCVMLLNLPALFAAGGAGAAPDPGMWGPPQEIEADNAG